MIKIALIILSMASTAQAEWMLNPYTQRQDYYQPQPYVYVSSATIDNHLTALDLSTAAIGVSTASLQTQLDLVKVSTGAISLSLTTETTTRIAADSAIGVTTGSLRTDLTTLALSTGPLATATAANTANMLVKRDASGNFSAGTITADGSALTGMDAYAKLASTQTFTGENTFASVTSTTTVSGWIDYGVVSSSAAYTDGDQTLLCPTGTKIISGGCELATANYFYKNHPALDRTGWNCYASGSSAFVIYAVCGRVK